MIQYQFKAAAILCMLYFLQGIPYGIQVKSMPIYYYDILKLPIETITKLSLLLSPWIFLKPLAICVIDLKSVSHFLLLFSVIANALLNVILYFLFHANTATFYYLQLIVFFTINCITVLLDIATDQLAITSAVSSSDIKFFGISNSIQIVAYKFGSFFSVFVLHFYSYENISNCFILISLMHGIAFSILVLTNYTKIEVHNDHACTFDQILTMSIILKMTFSLYNVILLLYIFTYKLGEIGALTILPLHLLEFGVSRGYVSYLSTAICEPVSLIGSLFGGFMWTWWNGTTATLLKILMIMSLMRSLPLLLLCFAFSPSFLLGKYIFELSAVSLLILSFIGGMVSTLTFTIMMIIACMAGKNAYASHLYSLFSCVEVFGKLIFSSYAGDLSKLMGKDDAYAFFCLANFSIVGFIYLLRKCLHFNNHHKYN